MAEIQVTSATLRSKAEELNGLNEQFKSEISTLTETEGSLRSGFEGETSEAFHAAFTKDTTQMGNFYNAIAQYVSKLEEIAANYEKAEQTNTATANERKY